MPTTPANHPILLSTRPNKESGHSLGVVSHADCATCSVINVYRLQKEDAELDGNIRIAVPTDWTAGEVGTVALEWAPQGGSQRLVAYVEASYDSAPPPFGSVNIVKFEVQTGNGP